MTPYCGHYPGQEFEDVVAHEAALVVAATLRAALTATPSTDIGARDRPENLDVDEVAARLHDSRYGVFSFHDGTGTPPFVEPVVACGYCRKAAERYVYAASERSRAALSAPATTETPDE